jgi:hypothetical protein
MTGKIFINYRRGDDAGNTGRLFDRLQDIFKPEQLFLDVDNIPPGRDFVRELNDRVAECDIVLAVIGKTWLEAHNAAGDRRLDDPDDFVRIEIVSALNQGKLVIPVLVGDADMPRPEDLPEALQPLARRNALRLTHERFRADMGGLVKALQQSLAEIEAERQAEEARRQADEQRRAEAAAKQQAEEEARRQAEEQRRAEAAAKQRAEEEERAFVLAKRAGTIAALEAFLARNPATAVADEARSLKAALLVRKEAFGRASASDRPAVLRAFLTTYTKGGDVDQIRGRLRVLELQQARQPRAATIISSALAVVLIAGGAVYWLKIKSPLPAGASVSADQAANGTSADTRAATGPSPDLVAWLLLKDTNDDTALKRFTEQFPNSPLREDAVARIAELKTAEAARARAAARAEAVQKAQAAQQAEAAARLEAANKAMEAERAKLALATPSDAGHAAPATLAGSALVQQIEMELMRVGCYSGQIDDNWSSSRVKLSVARFVKSASLAKTPDQPTPDFLNSIRGQSSRVCPLECAKTETASNGECIAKTCPSGQTLDSDGDCENAKEHTASHPAVSEPATASRSAPTETAPHGRVSAPASATEAQAVGIGISCGRFGCKTHAAHPAPGGLPCKQAWQDRMGAWHCS